MKPSQSCNRIAALACTIAVLAAPAHPARAQGATDAGTRPGAPRQHLRREIQRALRSSSDRLASLARRLVEQADGSLNLRDEFIELRIRARSAEAEYLNAKLAREIAEIAIREYSAGVYDQQMAKIEGTIRLAESDHERARDLIELAQTDAARQWAQLREEGTRLALDAAQMKRTHLVNDSGPRRVRELEADVARRRTLERTTEARWKALVAQESRIQQAIGDEPAQSTPARRGPDAVARAVALLEQVRTRLDGLAKGPESGEAVLKEIREQTNELETLVNEAEAAVASDELERVKPFVRATVAGRR